MSVIDGVATGVMEGVAYDPTTGISPTINTHPSTYYGTALSSVISTLISSSIKSYKYKELEQNKKVAYQAVEPSKQKNRSRQTLTAGFDRERFEKPEFVDYNHGADQLNLDKAKYADKLFEKESIVRETDTLSERDELMQEFEASLLDLMNSPDVQKILEADPSAVHAVLEGVANQAQTLTQEESKPNRPKNK